jgi:hypothetical protein
MPLTLIVGGLTVDRFADGSVAPGGSVLHSGLATVAEGAALATLTVAGDELAARDGLARLTAMGELVHQAAATTTTYRHGERAGVRVMVLEARSDPIAPDGLRRVPHSEVALVAPIADEVPASVVDRLRLEVAPRWTVLLVQGWLRHLVVGEELHPLPLEALSADQVRVMSDADAIVISTEDLTEARGDPFAQAAKLRRRVGPRPILLVTLGPQGYLLDDPARERVLASVPRRVVTGVSTNGAGDMFGAALAVNLARGTDASAAADRASERVIGMLESRRGKVASSS